MARYRGTVLGNRGEVSRLGAVVSGLHTSCSGWNVGVDCSIEADGDKDFVRVYITEGSNGTSRKLLGILHEDGAFELA